MREEWIMKVRIKQRPTGYVSFGGGPLQAWPKVDAVIDLPDEVAKPMVDNGSVEVVRMVVKTDPVETRPAPSNAVETRKPGPPKDSEK